VLAATSPAPRSGTVAICFVMAALEPVRARGMDTDSIVRQAGISPMLLNCPRARVSAKQYGELWRHVALLLDDELFAQDSRRMKAGTFAMICNSVLSCESLHQAFERVLRFFRLVLDDISCGLNVGNYETGLQLVERDDQWHVFGHECLLMLIHGLACWLVGRRIPIIRAEFAYPEPPHSAEYRWMYTAELAFQSQHTALFFESKYLKLKIVQNRRSLKDFLRIAPEGILVKYKDPIHVSAKVRRHLQKSLGNEPVAFGSLATAVNMTAATLRRRLQDEGTTYQAIKDQVRRELAVKYLGDFRRSTTEIGLDLGYSERSAFHRAFRSWTGVAPGEFRRQLQPNSRLRIKK
jgi:AraC-like DNA-binding protein